MKIICDRIETILVQQWISSSNENDSQPNQIEYWYSYCSTLARSLIFGMMEGPLDVFFYYMDG
jgi:hypothetical protein